MFSNVALISALSLSSLALIQAAPLSRSLKFGIGKRFVGTTGVYIQPEGTSTAEASYCLMTSSAATGPNVPLKWEQCSTSQDSNPLGANYALWNIDSTPGSVGAVMLTGTDYCLDAGSDYDSDNGTPASISTCIPGRAAQTFEYTSKDAIMVSGSEICLEIVEAQPEFGKCTTSGLAVIQAFYLNSGNFPTVAMGGRAIHPDGDDSLCLTIDTTAVPLYSGAPVNIAECGTGNAGYQSWSFNAPGVETNICSTYGGGFCLDLGTDGGSDGSPITVTAEAKFPGRFGQELNYMEDFQIAVVNGTQCLTVQAGTNNVQSFACIVADPSQVWTLNL